MTVKDNVNSARPIVLFDGVCNLCNGIVQFLIQRDTKGIFRFASLQSDIGKTLLAQYNLSIDAMNTIVFIENKQAFTHSTAALKIASHLGLLWSWTKLFWLLPKTLRDIGYNWISNNRYRWFGKKEQCMLPRKEWKNRFLEP